MIFYIDTFFSIQFLYFITCFVIFFYHRQIRSNHILSWFLNLIIPSPTWFHSKSFFLLLIKYEQYIKFMPVHESACFWLTDTSKIVCTWLIDKVLKIILTHWSEGTDILHNDRVLLSCKLNSRYAFGQQQCSKVIWIGFIVSCKISEISI